MNNPMKTREKVVGAKGFEPSTSWSRTRRASQAALRPDSEAIRGQGRPTGIPRITQEMKPDQRTYPTSEAVFYPLKWLKTPGPDNKTAGEGMLPGGQK